MAVPDEPTFTRIELVQAATVRADPQRTGTIFRDDEHAVVTQTLGIRGIMKVALELSRGTIQAVESAAIGSHPKKASGVLEDTRHPVPAQAFRISRVVLVSCEGAARVARSD